MVIEILDSPHGGPPGARGQHPASSSLWVRFGPDRTWHRVTATRSKRKALAIIRDALEVSEVSEENGDGD